MLHETISWAVFTVSADNIVKDLIGRDEWPDRYRMEEKRVPSRQNKTGSVPGYSGLSDPLPLSCLLGHDAKRVDLVLNMPGNI